MELQVNENGKRLEKIEDKLDKLSEAVVSIARIEERVTTVLKQNDRLFSNFEKLELRVDKVENKANINAKTVSVTERFIWIVLSAIVAAIMYNLR
jgi:hypothetical protein|tara:strand:+ start:180 stop:464 length:285 start_codon:yes stop_codon:yes gene_type:complete